MKVRLTRVRLAMLIGVAALTAAGVAVAVTSTIYTDASGAYHGCVSSGTGALRVVMPGDACRTNEAAVEWNQTGPQGERGEKGDPGAPGPAGKDGGSVAYTAFITNRQVPITVNGALDLVALSRSPWPATPTEILTLDLPAGSYMIQATVSNDAQSQTTTLCRLEAESEFDQSRQLGRLAYSLAHTFDGPGEVALRCLGANFVFFPAGPSNIRDATIIATPVASIARQDPPFVDLSLQNLTRTNITVRNHGTRASGPFRIGVSNPKESGTGPWTYSFYDVPSIEPKSVFSIDTPCLDPIREIRIDHYNVVAEVEENNNVFYLTGAPC